MQEFKNEDAAAITINNTIRNKLAKRKLNQNRKLNQTDNGQK